MLTAVLLAAFAAAPNVVIISVDTLRADRLSCYGYQHPTSPNIDALAARGVLFEDMVCEVPLTAPSMGAMLSSRVPRSTGLTRNGLPMPGDIPLVAERFQAAGYQTLCVQSNWTLKADMSGLDRGFEVYEDDFNKRRWGFLVAERDAKEVNKIALDLLARRDAERPLFLWVHYSDPHAPYKWRRKFNAANADRRQLDTEGDIGARYDSEVAYTDWHIGEVLNALPKENTFVVFVADHGESLMEHGYLGHGRKIYHNNLHIPFIVAGPGIETRRSDAPVRGLDFGPTVLGLAGLEPLPGAAGVDALRNAPGEDRIRIVETYGGAAIVPGMKEEMAEAGPLFQSLIAMPWKLIREGGGVDEAELFDLSGDPGELKDMSEADRARVEALSKALDAWVEGHPLGELENEDLGEDDLEALKNLGYL